VSTIFSIAFGMTAHFREKAGGRYTVGFFLRLPAGFSGAIALAQTAMVRLTKG